MTVVLIIVAGFFIAALGIMVRAEMKSVKRRKISAFSLSPKGRTKRILGETYIFK